MRLEFRAQKRAENQTKSAEGTKGSLAESDQSSPMTATETNTFKEIPFSRESQAKIHQTNVGTIDPTTKAISEKTQVEESAVSLKTLDLFPKVSSSNTAFDQSLYSTPTASYRLVIKKSLHNIIAKSTSEECVFKTLSTDRENQPSEKLSSSVKSSQMLESNNSSNLN